MTVHAIKIKAVPKGNGNGQKIQSAFNKYKQRNGRWIGDTQDHTIVQSPSGERWTGMVRFEWSESRGELIDDIVTRLQGKTESLEIWYHECDHDEEERTPNCNWSLEYTA